MSMYDRDAVAFMWKELEAIGVTPLTTEDAVTEAISSRKGTTLVVVNSVCGCAAGGARPGVALALQNKKIPDNLTTVFAGVDIEATKKARELMPQVQPTSPSVFLFKDGELVHAVNRMDIEGFSPDEIALKLTTAFDQHCEKAGPSVAPEVLSEVFNLSGKAPCGSTYENE